MSKFKLTVVGSGTMTPTKRRHPSCYLLEVGSRKLLLDIGHTSIARLVDLGIDLHSIDILFVSHFHTDHFADALPFVHSRWIDDLYIPEDKQTSLSIIGPETIKERWTKLREVFWVEPEEDYRLNFLEGVQNIDSGEIGIQLFEVSHVPWYQSLGIKVSFGEKSFVYTGDIGGSHDIESLKEIVEGVDLLLIEAGNVHPTPNHFTIDQIIELTEGLGIKKIIATHIRDRYLPTLKEKAKDTDNIVFAEDLMEVEIKD